MSVIYLDESGATISVLDNRFCVHFLDGTVKFFPIETIESITIMGNSGLTTPVIQTCLKMGICVVFLSKGGRYFGRLLSTGHVNAARQRMQVKLYESNFATELSRRIVDAKIRNQLVVLKRYEKGKFGKDVSKEKQMMQICINSLKKGESISEIMGYEGTAAKYYFSGISKCINPDFQFNGRNRRPPKDPFNSMISLGYSILMNEFYGKIEAKGMNPYFGFMHRDKEKHPTLASDLMEEWRAVIIDSVVLSMINGNEVKKEDFLFDEEYGCYLTKEVLKKYITKLNSRFQTKNKYLSKCDFEVSFRYAMTLQLDDLINAMTEEDASLYNPIIIR